MRTGRAMRHGLLALVLAAAPALAPAGDVFAGKRLYRTYCAACHGPGGAGALPGTPNFTRGHALMQPDLSLLETIRAGRNAMPGFKGVLDEHEMLDVIAYIRTFH